ncbi:MAG: purine-cytosine permease family protein [Steroidobacteraceae bacterium]
MIETRSIDYVPLAERHGKVRDLWPVWFSGEANLATLAVGVIGVAMGLSMWWTTIAVVGGCALGTFFMAFHSTQGPQLGLPQLIQSRPQFGYLGALLVWVVALVAYIGYNAFNCVLAAQATRQLLGGSRVPDAWIILCFSALALAMAAVGYDWIHRVQRLFAYFMLLLLGAFTLAALWLIPIPATLMRLGELKTTPFLVQFFAAAAYQLSWSIYVSDYSRYLPANVGVAASFWWTYLGAFIGGVWMMLIGTLAAAISPHPDVAAAVQASADLVTPGFGFVLLAGGILGLVSITGLNFYGASLTLLSVADCVKPQKSGLRGRIVTLLLAFAVSLGLALMSSPDFANRFDELLSVLLYLFTPWTAINLVDFYWVRKCRYSVREIFNPHGIYGRWSWRGLLAYAIGFAAMAPFFSTRLYRGPVAMALGGADLAMLVGLPVSAIVYIFACRSLDREQEWAAAASADRGLDPHAATSAP